ncbi:MAG: 3-oxoacid CoA-transferase subunit A [Chloroflexi bacterium]|nr:3-oxoacid CoA-transferase subunit A [Chloroflexota bacterium]MDA1239699.1 3-oxoacid CoA-transferase subunit A [Chloroflexota bacterium]
MIDKVVATFDEAVADIASGARVHCGGFASPFNMPSYLIAALARLGADGLTVASTSAGTGMANAQQLREQLAPIVAWPMDYWDPGLLAELGRIKRLITTFPVSTGHARMWPFEAALERGEVELELIGQGSLAERIRCAKAGIAGFYTPVGPGTATAEGKEVRDFDGVPHVLERALHADFAIIRAWKADRYGNLVFRGARTFNETMAGAARVTIAEVDEVVPLGDLAPDAIHTPGVYVQRIVVRPAAPAQRWEDPC